MNIQEVRKQYPQYSDLSDEQLGKALHAKYYADMPYEQFTQKVKIPVSAEPDDPGVLASMGLGFGRTADKVVQGGKQAALTVAGHLPGVGARKELDRMKGEQAFRDEGYAALQKQHPIATVVGESAPLVALPLGGTLKAASMIGALPGLVEYGTPQEKLMKGGLGAFGSSLGHGLGNMIGRVAQPVRAGEMTQTQQMANQAADRLGVRLSAGEASGNRALKWAESASADLPIASGMATKRHVSNAKAMNAGALREMGQRGDEVTEAILAKARADTSGEYSRILDPAKIELDNTFRAEVKAITGSKVMKELRNEDVDALIGQFRDMPQGKVSVSGEWFQQNKSALDAQVRASYINGESGKARALEQFEKALDRAAMRSLSEADRDAYKVAQKQWASLRLLETGKVVDGGNVMPGRLDQALASRYKGAYKEGKIGGEMADIARLANTLRSPPNSGTATRAIYSGMAGGAAMFEPLSAAAMLAGPASVQALTTSPAMRKYMERGLLGVSTEMDELLKRSGGLLGLSAAGAAY